MRRATIRFAQFRGCDGIVPVKDAAGKHIHFSGYIKTKDVTEGYAGLWWRVDGSSDVLAFDNMRDRGVTGTTDWKRYDIEMTVAADATNINFGALFPANGTAWFDSLAIEVDGVPYLARDILNLDFESPLLDNSDAVRYPSNTPLGFHAGGSGYQMQSVGDVFHTGKQSSHRRLREAPRQASATNKAEMDQGFVRSVVAGPTTAGFSVAKT